MSGSSCTSSCGATCRGGRIIALVDGSVPAAGPRAAPSRAALLRTRGSSARRRPSLRFSVIAASPVSGRGASAPPNSPLTGVQADQEPPAETADPVGFPRNDVLFGVVVCSRVWSEPRTFLEFRLASTRTPSPSVLPLSCHSCNSCFHEKRRKTAINSEKRQKPLSSPQSGCGPLHKQKVLPCPRR